MCKSVEDVHAWIGKTLTEWGTSKELIKVATNSVISKRIDGQVLLASSSEGAESLRVRVSLPESSTLHRNDANLNYGDDLFIKRHAQHLLDALSAKVLCKQ